MEMLNPKYKIVKIEKTPGQMQLTKTVLFQLSTSDWVIISIYKKKIRLHTLS